MLTKRQWHMRNLAVVLLAPGVTKLARVDRHRRGFTIHTVDTVPEQFEVTLSQFARCSFLNGEPIEVRPVNVHTGYRLRMLVRKLATDGLVSVPDVMFQD